MLFIPVKSRSKCLFVPLCFAHSALSEEEKTTLRAGLITNFNEPVNQVSYLFFFKVILLPGNEL